MTDGIEDKMFPNIGQIASLGSHVADDATCTDMDNLDDQSLTGKFRRTLSTPSSGNLVFKCQNVCPYVWK